MERFNDKSASHRFTSSPLPQRPEPSPLQVRLEQLLGSMIREAEPIWDDLPKPERARLVRLYQLQRDCLRHITGCYDPFIPCPWTDEEVLASMAGYSYSSVGALSVLHSKLVTDVRVAERSPRRPSRSTARRSKAS